MPYFLFVSLLLGVSGIGEIFMSFEGEIYVHIEIYGKCNYPLTKALSGSIWMAVSLGLLSLSYTFWSLCLVTLFPTLLSSSMTISTRLSRDEPAMLQQGNSFPGSLTSLLHRAALITKAAAARPNVGVV